MAGTSLQGIVNGSFLSRLSGAGQTSSLSSSPLRVLGATAASSSISDALRTGARIYSSAVESLNSTISFLSLSRSNLEELGQITGELIKLAEEGTGSNVGTQRRERLESKYRELARDFEQLVEEADIEGQKFLTVDGLTEIFDAVGLDQDHSRSIAEVFGRFVTADDSDTLAAEEIKGDRPQNIPADVFSSGGPEEQYATSANYLNIDPDVGYITSVNRVHEARDTALNYNPSYDSLITETHGATLSGLAPGLSSSINLEAVNEDTGYSVISSTEDFLGYNTSNVTNFFLVDNIGNVVQQVSDFQSAFAITAAYTADISADNKTVAISYINGGSNELIDVITIGTIGEDPSTSTVNNVVLEANPGYNQHRDIRLNDAGDTLLYDHNNTNDVTLHEIGVGSTTYSDADGYGFIGDSQFAIYDSTGQDVKIRNITGGAVADTYSIGEAALDSSFTTLQSDEAFAFATSASNTVKLVEYNLGSGNFTTDTVTTQFSAGTIDTMSLAVNENGFVDVGVVTTDDGADTRTDLYRFTNSGFDFSGEKLTNQVSKNLESVHGIATSTNVFSTTDGSDYLDYNDTYDSVFQISVGSVIGGLAPGISNHSSLKAVNEDTGFSVIASEEDFLGFNSSNFDQLFLVDPTGKVVQQLTDSDATVRGFNNVDITADNKTVIFQEDDGNILTFEDLQIVSFTDYNTDPSTLTYNTAHTNLGGNLSNAKISDDGSYVALFDDTTTDDQLHFKDTATFTADIFLRSDINNVDFAFTDSNRLAIIQKNGTQRDLVEYTDGNGAYVNILSDIGDAAAGMDAIEGTTDYQISFFDSSARTFSLYRGSDSAIVDTQLYGTGTMTALSIAQSTTDSSTLFGLHGELGNFTGSGDSDGELYEGRYGLVDTGPGVSTQTKEFDTVFDSEHTLLTRVGSYRLLNDLEALQKQIEDNIDALDHAGEVVGDNLAFIRGTAVAFLDISEQISGDEDADAVARDLRGEIRTNARSALGAAANLESITVAALLLDDATSSS